MNCVVNIVHFKLYWNSIFFCLLSLRFASELFYLLYYTLYMMWGYYLWISGYFSEGGTQILQMQIVKFSSYVNIMLISCVYYYFSLFSSLGNCYNVIILFTIMFLTYIICIKWWICWFESTKKRKLWKFIANWQGSTCRSWIYFNL